MSRRQHNLNKMTAVTTKRKRVSKKSKKSWRKNVDITDVDNFLEDQRLQERLGIKYDEEKDENLFEIDTTGDVGNNEPPSAKPGTVKPNSAIIYETNSFPMRLRETEVPKCFEILHKRSAVDVPIKIPKRLKQNALKESALQRKQAATNYRALKKSNNISKSEKNEPGKALFTYDVWAKKEEKTMNNEWLTSDTLRHNLQNIGKHKKKIPKSLGQKTSLLPAIETPHPGSSYNPSLKDHQDVLMKVAEKELENMKEEKHLNRVTRDMFSKVTKEEQEKNWLAEMTVGLTATKGDSEEEDDGQEYKALNPPVKNKKKTLQKRRRLREAMELKEKLKNEKINKRKLSDIYKLRIFNESLNKREKRILRNMEKKKEKKLKRGFKTKALSQIKYKEPELDFLMAEELSGNLRNVKPEGNLVLERYKSLQKRNILQPTVKRVGTKRKVKQYERNHTKMDWELGEKSSFKKTKRKIM